MNIQQLRYFITVAEHLNFSRAADTLFIAQPTLSYQIAELEKELNCSLFNRNKRKVFLTPAGGVLLPLARQTIEDAQRIYDVAARGAELAEHLLPIRIALDKTEDHFEAIGVTQAIASFDASHPEIQVNIRQMAFSDCVSKLLSDELDVAFLVLRCNETLPSELVCKPIRRDFVKLVWRLGESYQTCQEVCERYSIILADDHPQGHNRIERILGDLQIKPRYIHVDSIAVAMVYMQLGKGAIVLPEHLIRQRNYTDINILDIPTPCAEMSHMMVWNKYANNPSIQLLLNMM